MTERERRQLLRQRPEVDSWATLLGREEGGEILLLPSTRIVKHPATSESSSLKG